ncbi:oxygenase MpaB family protein [Saccharopolyspora sp. TS4A08]|uniref:Oxygenase MpaB family protein n=1 Tax=Saccharopolyspora ipomoeae TaxID=3042027 RepID=A0ABT6PLF2_9PSEU|nr:oxygenase MpaB family protein [Saccharopolyspora sp. TS4A08]MDI2028764.1 oxygenase MpaB family protein [Saccharopolyspora sp. TS4A08]
MAVDEGLFGPRTVTWQLHGDPTMWIAGICSLFLQALHPRAVAAVVQNSRFQQDPIGRLRRTSDFVGVATYGTTDKAAAAAERVRHVHRALSASDPRTGERIRLDDPDLLLWVHCAEVATFAEVVRRAGFPLTDAQHDRYLDEQRRSAELVGLDPQRVPGSRGEVADYFRRVRPELARTDESEVVFRFLHHPLRARRWRPLNLGYLPIGRLAYSLLPNWAHDLHGRTPLPESATTAGARAFRAAGKAVPDRLRYRFPSGHVLRAVERLGEGAFPSARSLAEL